jgi:hypothetical protein
MLTMAVIIMADIIGSSDKKGKALMANFMNSVENINRGSKEHILSPLTVTLGDEFQGVAKNVYGAISILLDFEYLILRLKNPYQLRYVVYEGEIDTKINRSSSHQMLGSGLTQARSALTELKSTKNRFKILLKDELLTEKLNYGFFVFQGIVDRWTVAQKKVVIALLHNPDYKEVAKIVKKDPTVIWRRKRSLMIEEYFSIRKLIMLLVNPKLK